MAGHRLAHLIDATQIDRQDAFKGLLGHIENRFALVDASAIHQDVDAAEASHYILDPLSDGILAGNVDLEALRFPSHGADRRRDRLHRFDCTNIRRGDDCPRPGHPFAQNPANPAGGAGDQGHPALQ